MKKKIVNILIISLLTLIFSCQKYEEGGRTSKGDTRLLQSWELHRYYRDDINYSTGIMMGDYFEAFSSSGTYTRSYSDTAGFYREEYGTYSLTNSNETIVFGDTLSFFLTMMDGKMKVKEVTISRMKRKELWYYFKIGEVKHQLQFVKKKLVS